MILDFKHILASTLTIFLYYPFKTFAFLILLFYLNFNKRFKTFSKIIDYNRLIKSSNKIIFSQNRLKILKMGCLISDFFQLVLKVFSKLVLNIVNKSLEIFKVFLEKDFKLK